MSKYLHDNPKDCKCICHSGDPKTKFMSEAIPWCPSMGDGWAPLVEVPDGICDQCDSTGEVDGRVCKSCQGKGYVNP